MGSISVLKSILLLVDLCTCRISNQNQNLKWFTLGDFSFIKYKYTHVSWYCCLGLNNSLLVIVSKKKLVCMSFGLTQQVLWYCCRGLINSPLVAVS